MDSNVASDSHTQDVKCIKILKNSFEIVIKSCPKEACTESVAHQLATSDCGDTTETSDNSDSSTEHNVSIPSVDEANSSGLLRQLSNNELNALNSIDSVAQDAHAVLTIYHAFISNRENKDILRNVHMSFFNSKADSSKSVMKYPYLLLKRWLDMSLISMPTTSVSNSELNQSTKTANYVSIMEFVLVSMVKSGFISSLFLLKPFAVEIYKDLMQVERVRYVDYFYEFNETWKREFIERYEFFGLFESHFLDNSITNEQKAKQLNQLEIELMKNEQLQNANTSKFDWRKEFPFQTQLTDEQTANDDESVDDSVENFPFKIIEETPYPQDVQPIEDVSVTPIGRANFSFAFDSEHWLQTRGNTLQKGSNSKGISWMNSSIKEFDFNREKGCDCMNACCNGCFPKCFRCGSHKCKVLCRYLKDFHIHDLIRANRMYAMLHPDRVIIPKRDE